MFHPLQQDHLVIHHLLIAFDVLLQDDFDSIFLPSTFRFSYDSVGTRSQCPAKLVLGSARQDSVNPSRIRPETAATYFLS